MPCNGGSAVDLFYSFKFVVPADQKDALQDTCKACGASQGDAAAELMSLEEGRGSKGATARAAKGSAIGIPKWTYTSMASS